MLLITSSFLLVSFVIKLFIIVEERLFNREDAYAMVILKTERT